MKLTRMGELMSDLLPERYRDEIVGDIIEEARLHDESDHARSRRINAELARSIPSLFTLNFQKNEDESMKHAKWIAGAAILVFGFVQAWDSGILAAPPWIGGMVAFAIAIGLAGLFTTNDFIRFGIAVMVFVLLFVARILSPVNLPELGLIGMPIFLILVLGPKFLALSKEKNRPQGPGTAA